MGNLGAYATERRENPDEGMGVGPEGSMLGIGKEAVRGGGERRESAQRQYKGERCEGATAPARNPPG